MEPVKQHPAVKTHTEVDAVVEVTDSDGGRQAKRAKRGTRRVPDVDELNSDLEQLKNLRGRKALVDQEVITIVYAYTKIKRDHILEKEQQKQQGHRASTMEYQKKVADLLGYSTSTVSAAFSKWNKAKSDDSLSPSQIVSTPSMRGHNTKRKERIPNTKRVITLVRDFLQESQFRHRRITAAQILTFLREKGIVKVATTNLGGDDSKDTAAALRATQRFLQRSGFHYGPDSTIKPMVSGLQMLAHYVKTLLANRELPPHEQLREVYAGEIYIDKRFSQIRGSVTDRTLIGSKSSRACILLAFQGKNPQDIQAIGSDDGTDSSPHFRVSQHASLIPHAAWFVDSSVLGQRDTQSSLLSTPNRNMSFSMPLSSNVYSPLSISAETPSSSEEMHHQVTLPVLSPSRVPSSTATPRPQMDTSQYAFLNVSDSNIYAMNNQLILNRDKRSGAEIDAQTFTWWFSTCLLANLRQRSLIILDATACHRALPEKIPDPSHMTKAELLAALRKRNVADISDNDFTFVLKSRLETWIRENVQPEIVAAAESQGHRVLFLPPGYWDLQPMNLLGALIREEIHLQRDKGKLGNLFEENPGMEAADKRRSSDNISTEDVKSEDEANNIRNGAFNECLRKVIEILSNDVGQHRRDGKTILETFIDTANAAVRQQRCYLAADEDYIFESAMQGESLHKKASSAKLEQSSAKTAEQTATPMIPKSSEASVLLNLESHTDDDMTQRIVSQALEEEVNWASDDWLDNDILLPVPGTSRTDFTFAGQGINNGHFTKSFSDGNEGKDVCKGRKT